MTVQELISWCIENDVSLETHIALRAKDDYLLTADKLAVGNPYFGNCNDGEELVSIIAPRTADDEIDYDNVPGFLILDTGRV
ncbi:hypothetical protein [Acinetobacter sp.]|uniref:hypothetical protein n=1 Tax=Acinetobacter sp. TaxID=472 RepID=UPI00388F95F3